MGMHFSIVFCGWCFKTNRQLYCHCPCTSKLLNPDGASKQIGQQYCPVSTMHFKVAKSGWCFKTNRITVMDMHENGQISVWIYHLKMFIAETYPFSRKLPGKRKFSRKLKFSRYEISRKCAHFRFSRKWKNRFHFNPSCTHSGVMIPIDICCARHRGVNDVTAPVTAVSMITRCNQ
jgi:hypothetical protein